MPGARLESWRALGTDTIVLLVTAYLALALNGPWWMALLAGRPPGSPATWLLAVATGLAIIALQFIMLSVLSNRWTVRPLLILVSVVTAAADYYTRSFAVVMDRHMIQNVLQTDVREASDLLTGPMALGVLARAALPVAFLLWVQPCDMPWRQSLRRRALTALAAVGVAAASLLAVSGELTALMREQHQLRYRIAPANWMIGLANNLQGDVADRRAPRQTLGADAHMAHVPGSRPKVLVLVLGETARAANFSLLGYERSTNPELARRPVVVFRDVTACGTSTAVSVPCLFSVYGRENYDEDRIRHTEGLLDVAVHAGYDVRWRDNQSGCKGVCDGPGVDYRKIAPALAPELCMDGECLDEILVRSLAFELQHIARPTLIVLHMMGNHGPAYFKRYPASQRFFTPDCRTVQLGDCSAEELRNAYDNGIRYTDHVLALLIDTLAAAQDRFDTSMIYVSDHGESLGEGGLYLHGMPYRIAPDVQTKVPLIAWMPARGAAAPRLERSCLRAAASRPVTHDYIFHSVIGLLDIETSVYQANRDLFGHCGA